MLNTGRNAMRLRVRLSKIFFKLLMRKSLLITRLKIIVFKKVKNKKDKDFYLY
jgi:hypothetical protein